MIQVKVQISDGQTHKVSLYVMDWDGGGVRRQSITVTNLDGDTLDTLDAATVGTFAGGTYASWTVTFTVQVSAGANALVNGVFID
ncbi:hypothetical protein ACFPIJ_14060 [Dactylosporangium cerinum]|uniref:Uncharacterized protein n=1 Tax=Dactylosporangium cerinum TaxID=1434730 RepID=A0ABV9VTT3_9ACTN